MKTNINKLLDALELVTSFKEGTTQYENGISLWEEVSRNLESRKDSMYHENINAESIIMESWSSKKIGIWSLEILGGVRITHIPTGIQVTCDSERSQFANRHLALEELTAILSQKSYI